MTSPGRTRHQPTTNTDLRSSVKRAVGIPETAEIVPPEGSAASDQPPVNTKAIRYWLVHDGRRVKRHHSVFAAFTDPAARQRCLAVLSEVRRSGLRALAPLVGVVAALLVVGWLVAVWAVVSGVSPALLSIGLFGCSLLLLWPMAASGFRLRKVLAESYLHHDLSHDEGGPLTVVAVLTCIGGYVALIYLTVPVAALILRLVAGVIG